MSSYPIAVLASGRGSNLAALIKAERSGALPIEIVLVASDKAHAAALRVAEEAGIATIALDPAGYGHRADFDVDLFARVGAYAPELIVLAGFMRILDPRILDPWLGRVINIHPALLPKHRGLRTHERALAAGDVVHGASVHYVTAELDGGPVIAQAEFPVAPGSTSASLATQLLPLEHALLVACVGLIATRRIELVGDAVRYDDRTLQLPLQLREDGVLAPMP